ncbi:ABC transporter permease [[Haemophilus] felis]|uniref:Transport permease protein n=1 Tax=[Haemophilus] felis TaxID=123822 RepID=A0A1T0AXZ7_9PAST|nr:ABC transporter permease [[Haemophilus] felis]NBI41618.1 ABC transporter permease [[Haemophilus] felis]NBI43546.1 ABC transporter permease [[Haemophilus] felis]OOS02672.1 ABC transporter permease [[Haemophilus] felis]
MKQPWIAFYTILRKEIRRFTRIWVQTLVPPVITMSLYFVIFGQLIGSRIGQIQGVSYMQFIVPGLIMMSALTNSFANVASSFYSTKFAKNVEELLISPTSPHIIILGYVAGGMARGISVGILVTLVSLFFTSFQIQSWSILLATLLMTTAAFSLAGLINAVFARSFDDISLIPTFVLTPLTYLGGVFYSLSQLPEFFQLLSKINPIVYMVNGFRYGFLGFSDIPVFYTFVLLSLFITSLYCFAYYLIRKGIGLRS